MRQNGNFFNFHFKGLPEDRNNLIHLIMVVDWAIKGASFRLSVIVNGEKDFAIGPVKPIYLDFWNADINFSRSAEDRPEKINIRSTRPNRRN